MTGHYLNLATKLFPESEAGGLLVCGINWGGEPDAHFTWSKDIVGESFFSDTRVNNYPYRNRLLRWFELFAHPLETEEAKAGRFERSIVQTNWIRGQAPNMNGADLFSECVREWSNMEFHLRRLRPKLIMFMSVKMLEVLNSRDCIDGARQLLGREVTPIDIQKRDVTVGGARHKRFRVGLQRFERAQLIALPHPTGTRGLSDDYIAAFADVISPLLGEYRSEEARSA